MPLSPFDAIMPIKPTHSAEPGRRSSGVESDFRPALSKAYAAERPKPTPPTRPEKHDQPPVERNRQDESPKLGSEQDRRSNSAATSEESADVKRAKAGAEGGDDRPDEREDVVEVSAAGAAAPVVSQQAAQAQEVAEEASVAAELAQGVEDTAPEEAASAEAIKTQRVGEASPEGDAEFKAAQAASQSQVDESSKADGESEMSQQLGEHAEAEPSADETAVAQKPDAKGRPLDGMIENAEVAPADETAGEITASANKKPRPTLRSEPAEVANQPVPMAAAVAAAETVPTPATDVGGATPVAVEGAAPIQTESKSSTGAGDRAASALERLSARAMRNTEKADGPDGHVQMDRARFVQRVEGAIRAAHQRDGKIQVRLSPPELGSLRIELAVQNGVMTAKIEAETPTARNALLDSLPQLRERLAQQDIRVEKFDVDVRRDGGNAQGGNPFEQSDGQSREERQPHRPTPLMSRLSSTKSTPIGATSQVADGALDVRI